MDLHSDFPFWTVKSGIIRAFPPMMESQRCDALVVGGGITGALLSDTLCREGVDTVVVDRRDIGHGSTSASTALLQYEIDKPLYELRERVGRRVAERAYHMGIQAIDQIGAIAGNGSDFIKCPSLFVSKDRNEMGLVRREFAARKEAGLPVALIEKSQLLARFGIARHLGILSSAAASVDPYRLAHSIFARWLGKGLRVFDRTTVLSYHHLRSGVTAKTDRGASIRAGRIFFASGFESQEILRQKFVRLRSTYALVSEPTPMAWWKRKCLVWESGDPYLYARPTPDGRVLVGGEDDGVLSPARRDAQTPAKARIILRKFHRLFPGSRLEEAFCWSGVFGSTKDGMPYIGTHPSFPKGYFALGFGGNGITFSMMASRILTDMVLGRVNDDAGLYRFER
jgi:glycine/D-amino acid oxidase-like deaminating enzyme